MTVVVKEVLGKKDLKKFVKFPFSLYKDNAYWVPPLIADDMDTFSKDKNPSFETADAKFFLAYKDEKLVGRIAAINSHAANEKYNTKNIRFGWFDSIDDLSVSQALFDKVVSWAKELGLNSITGPHGFTDMDPEGLLTYGFDQLGTIATVYTHPYYVNLVENYGFVKEVDYFEYKGTVPTKEGVPPKMLNIVERLRKRSGLKLLNQLSRSELKNRSLEVMKLMEECFEEIYGSVPMTSNQLNYYIKKYFSFVNPKLINLVEDKNGKLVAFLITMPSLSKAMQKSRGKLFPFGFLHLLKAIKGGDILDFYLAGVKKEYRGSGADLLMVVDICQKAINMGFKYSESNVELEHNLKVQAQWKYFNPILHKKRRIYKKKI